MLTTHPLSEHVVHLARVSDHFFAPDDAGDGRDIGIDRVKCPVCGGHEYRQLGGGGCPRCHGTPPNEWACDAWPGLMFEMPDAIQ